MRSTLPPSLDLIVAHEDRKDARVPILLWEGPRHDWKQGHKNCKVMKAIRGMNRDQWGFKERKNSTPW